MSAVLRSAASSSTPRGQNDALLKRFDSRKSDELIIGLAGPIGCGIGSVVDGLKERLSERGYTHVVHIKLSKFLEAAQQEGFASTWATPNGCSPRLLRYRSLQEAGKDLRVKTRNPAILAEYAAQEIALDRNRRNRESNEGRQSVGPIIPGRVAYLIDQVKRPEEVQLLRAIYRNLFYVVGVTRVNDRRIHELEKEQVRSDEAQGLIDIDRLEGQEGGQQLDKTLHLA